MVQFRAEILLCRRSGLRASTPRGYWGCSVTTGSHGDTSWRATRTRNNFCIAPLVPLLGTVIKPAGETYGKGASSCVSFMTIGGYLSIFSILSKHFQRIWGEKAMEKININLTGVATPAVLRDIKERPSLKYNTGSRTAKKDSYRNTPSSAPYCLKFTSTSKSILTLKVFYVGEQSL